MFVAGHAFADANAGVRDETVFAASRLIDSLACKPSFVLIVVVLFIIIQM